MKIDELLERYVKLRDKKQEKEKAHKQEIAKYTEMLRRVEQILLDHFNETGADSVKTPHGTAYKTVASSVSVADRDVFLDFVRDQDAWAFLESRANKSAVEEYLAEHEALPPGLNMTRVAKVNIRRS